MRFEVHSTEAKDDSAHFYSACLREAEVVGRGSIKGMCDTAQKRWRENPAGLMSESAFIALTAVGMGLLAKRNPVVAAGLASLGGTSFAVTQAPRIPFRELGAAMDKAWHSGKKEDMERAANQFAGAFDSPLFDLGMAVAIGGPASIFGPRAVQRATFSPADYIRPVEPPQAVSAAARDISFGPAAFRCKSGWIIPTRSNRLGLVAEENITLETVRQPSLEHTGLRFYCRTNSETQAMRTTPRRTAPTFTEQP